MKVDGFLREKFSGLRHYLRLQRMKRREKKANDVKKAIVSLDLVRLQQESSHKIDSLLGDIKILRERVDSLVNRNVIQLDAERVAVRTPYGYVICPKYDFHLMIYLSEGGVHEPGTCRVIKSIVKPGDQVIDVGAQVGLLTLVMGRAVGASGSVLAVEASEVLAKCLKQTLALNGLSETCRVMQAVVSEKAGTATFHLSQRSGHSSLYPLDEDVAELKVSTVPLDDLVSGEGRIALVKIDVEGAEHLVLKGMSRILNGNPDLVLLVEFAPSHLMRAGQTIDQWLQNFKNFGFEHVFEIDENAGICKPLRTIDELANVFSLNLLLTRNVSPIISGLLEA